MRTRVILAVLAGVLAGACGGGGPGAGRDPNAVLIEPDFAEPVLLGELGDPAIQESSGLAASRRNADLFWTHNDSGDGPNIYCLDRQAARCGTWTVAGAEAIDWEDMAAGPGPAAGEQYLYLGDIGDNARARSDIVVYRVVEPSAPAEDDGTTTATAEPIRLRYPDGPHDAEALLVHPTTADIYVITKDALDAGVYKAAAGAAVLERIASFNLGIAEVVTAGDISADGRRAVVSTYQRAYELSLPDDATSFDAIWDERRRRVPLASRAQGETIAYRMDGDALLTTSEKLPMPLHEVVRR